MAISDDNPPSEYGELAQSVATWEEPVSALDDSIIDPEHAWLFRRYDGYQDNLRLWKFLDESYRGGLEWINGRNLPPHLLEMRAQQAARGKVMELQLAQERPESAGASSYETRSDYDLRKEQAFRAINIVREIIDKYKAMFGRQEPIMKLPSIPGLEDFTKEADIARSKTLTQLTLEAICWAFLYGVYYLAVDGSLSPEELEKAKQDLAAKGVFPNEDGKYQDGALPKNRPVAWHIDPADIVDGRFARDGTFLEVMVKERRDTGQTLREGVKIESCIRYWQMDHWELWALRKGEGKSGQWKGVQIGEGENKFGVIPVLQANPWPVSKRRWRGLSGVEDEMLSDRALAGLSSSMVFNLDNDLDTQVYGTTDLSELEGEDGKDALFAQQIQEAMRSRTPLLHRSVKLDVLNKGSGQAALALQAWNEHVRAILRVKGLGALLDDQQESGIALLRRFQMTNDPLVTMSHEQARIMRDSLFIAANMLSPGSGELITKETVTPVKQFDVRAVDEIIAAYEPVREDAVKEVRDEFVCDVIDRVLGPSRSKEEIDKLKRLQRTNEPPGLESEFRNLAANALPPGNVNAEDVEFETVEEPEELTQ